ncbi:hypothetical protein KU6B_50370 [Mameliella alba]|nr:hypothetical protein [Mameliella alba]BBU58772.1 hypothetical protein KU6B_50370 [Mameliella alba]
MYNPRPGHPRWAGSSQAPAATAAATVAVSATQQRGTAQRGRAQACGAEATHADQASGQHADLVTLVHGDRRLCNNGRFVDKDERVCRAPLAPFLGRAVLGKKRPALGLDESDFVQGPVGTQIQLAARVTAVEVIFEHDHAAIGQGDQQVIRGPIVAAHIRLTDVEGNFLAAGCVDQVTLTIAVDFTTFQNARTGTGHEFNRVHNHTALPLCPPVFLYGGLVISHREIT